MDYTKFLNKKEHVVLPYLGGPYVFAKDRRLRLDGDAPVLGFHRFEVSGRNARSLEVAESPELGGLPKARGHFCQGWLCGSSPDAALVRLSLLPEEEPPPLATTRARKWHSGDWLFEALDFDGEAEEEARLRLERGDSLADLKGVAGTLRTAYGIALAIATARRLETTVSPREVASHAVRIAEGGSAVATEIVQAIARERLEEADRARIRELARGATVRVRDGRITIEGRGERGSPGRGREAPSVENAAMRAEAALDGAHARMMASRVLSATQIEVTWQFMDERFISVVDAITLQVYDSGVCLAGEDDLVTLDSLPGVIREAIDTGRLVITRR